MEKMKSKMVKSIMMLLALASSNYSYASSFFYSAFVILSAIYIPARMQQAPVRK